MSPSVSLMPHAVCWAAAPSLVWTMVVTNLITFLSYLTICVTLLYLARRTQRVIASDWVRFLVGFALFIVACGSTHLMEVVTTWNPVFWIDAGTNIVTALLSAYVAVALIRRATTIAFGVNDYADRLAGAETEKRRLEESLLSAQKLEELSKMSSVVAHEINQPLAAIRDLLYLIRDDPSATPEIRQLADMAESETGQVITLSQSTLAFFRQTATPELIDLRMAAESVRFLLKAQMIEHKVRIEIEARGNVEVEALPGETRQVLLNLVRNACEATLDAGSTVEVRLEGESRGVRVEVVDHGQGIAPEMLARLFEFGVSSKGERGNGMGLWTVRQILTRHGGRIDVESQPGIGTTFKLFWPRRFAASSAPPAEDGKLLEPSARAN